MNPIVSIIVPIYNVEKYIKQCLLSIKNQTYTNYEVICINDGSSDHSEDIFYNTVGGDSRFTLYNQKNHGIAYVRNLGLKLSKGELITFVDSDDILKSNYLEVLVNGIIQQNCDISVGGHTIHFPSFKFAIHFPINIVLSQKIALSFLVSDTIIMNYSWGKCYKREVWKNISYPINKTYEDVETICQVFMKANQVFVSNQLIYDYIIRSGSISQQKGRNLELKRAYTTQMNVVVQKYPLLKVFGYMNRIKADLMNCYDTFISKVKTS